MIRRASPPDAAAVSVALALAAERFPNPGGMEISGGPFRVLVAVMLSARTRDEQVLRLLPGLFRAFPDAASFANADQRSVERQMDTIGMYRQKARHVRDMARMVVEIFSGRVPETMEDLVRLPGVGRKTASVVLVACFGKNAVAVDTHVHRVTNRLGWVRTPAPAQTEAALLRLVPPDDARLVNRVFVKLGRYLCLPTRPRCWDCPLREQCAYAKKNLVAPPDADAVRADIRRREAELEHLRLSV